MINLTVLISRLPLSFLYAIAWLLAVFNCYILRSKRAEVLNNLRSAFPEYSENEIHAICRKYYFTQAEFLVETMKLLSCRKRWLQKRVRLMNPSILDDVDTSRPVLLLSSHQSNWEWAAQVLFLHCGHPFYGVYKPLRSSKLEHLVSTIRRCFGGTPLPQKQFVKTLVKHRKQRCFFYVLSDREPDRRQKSIEIQWLGGQATDFYLGTAQLACTARCAVFYVRTEKVKKGHYRIYLEPIENQGKGHERDLLVSYAQKLARGLKNAPENWYWGQPRWRWKNEKTTKS